MSVISMGERDTERLRLFVRGPDRARLEASVREHCDRLLGRRYALVVVDVDDDPGAAVAAGILATPTLVREGPIRRSVVGDLRNPAALAEILSDGTPPRAVSA